MSDVELYTFKNEHFNAIGLIGVKWSKATLKGKSELPVGTRYFILCKEEEKDTILKEYMHKGEFSPWEAKDE